MLIRNTKTAAQKIIDSGCDEETIDSLAVSNSLLVYLTDENGSIIYSADEYKKTYYRNHSNYDFEDDGENPYHQSEKMNWQEADYRSLPDGYEDFLSDLKESEDGITEYETDNIYVYGRCISGNILYISKALDPVGETAGIIRILLLFVTAASFFIAFVLARIISGKFSLPVTDISSRAAKLGTEEYSSGLGRGFCSELDQLGETLDRTNTKLNEASNFQRELLANVSHDLRTPLTMIKGYAESIRDFGDNEEHRSGDTEIIIKEADRLTALVNDILEYSELQTGSRNTNHSPVNISRLTEGVIMRFEPLFASDGGTVCRDIEDDLYVNGCVRQLQRAVYNLTDNAIRYTGSSKRIKIVLRRADKHIRIEVTDFGKGIPTEQLPHIWDRYYTSRQRGNKGVSGLGLAIVKQIVSIHNGTCGVDTEENKGSTFWIELDAL
ncbi:MAG: sensor histidine kinase [Porcipelethomonas sp.]